MRKRTRTIDGTWHCRARCLKTTGLPPRASPQRAAGDYLQGSPGLEDCESWGADDDAVGDQDVAEHGC